MAILMEDILTQEQIREKHQKDDPFKGKDRLRKEDYFKGKSGLSKEDPFKKPERLKKEDQSKKDRKKEDEDVGKQARSSTDKGKEDAESGNESFKSGKAGLAKSHLREVLSTHASVAKEVTSAILSATPGKGMDTLGKMITPDNMAMMSADGPAPSTGGLQEITEPGNLDKSLSQAAELAHQLSALKGEQEKQVQELRKDMDAIAKSRAGEVREQVRDGNVLGAIHTSVINAVKNNSDQQNIQKAEGAVGQTDYSISAAKEAQSKIASHMQGGR